MLSLRSLPETDVNYYPSDLNDSPGTSTQLTVRIRLFALMAGNPQVPGAEADVISATSPIARKKTDGQHDAEAAAPSETAPSYSQEDGVEINYKTLEWWCVWS